MTKRKTAKSPSDGTQTWEASLIVTWPNGSATVVIISAHHSAFHKLLAYLVGLWTNFNIDTSLRSLELKSGMLRSKPSCEVVKHWTRRYTDDGFSSIGRTKTPPFARP